MRVFVVGRSIGYSRFINNLELVKRMRDAEVVLFTGGEDVDPSFYGCKRHFSTYSTLRRDIEEMKAFRQMKSNQVAAGICRGIQLFTVLHGGILAQDVSGHAIGGTHSITNGKDEYEITSLHHQMAFPFTIDKNEYDILYRSTEQRSSRYDGDKVDRFFYDRYGEPEIIRFHKRDYPLCLGVQGHPEMMPGSPVSVMINELLNELVDENRKVYSRRRP